MIIEQYPLFYVVFLNIDSNSIGMFVDVRKIYGEAWEMGNAGALSPGNDDYRPTPEIYETLGALAARIYSFPVCVR